MEGDVGCDTVTLLRSLTNGGVLVAVLNRARDRLLEQPAQHKLLSSVTKPQCVFSTETNTKPRKLTRVDRQSQISDDRFTSCYQVAHCSVIPTSPPVHSPEFPPQKLNPKHNEGNFKIGSHVSSQHKESGKLSHFRGGVTSPDRGPIYTCQPSRESDAFVRSLRKYPGSSPDRSNSIELLRKVLKQAKHSQKPIRTKSLRSLPSARQTDRRTSKQLKTLVQDIIIKRTAEKKTWLDRPDANKEESRNQESVTRGPRMSRRRYKTSRLKSPLKDLNAESTMYNYLKTGPGSSDVDRQNKREVKKQVHSVIEKLHLQRPLVLQCPNIHERYKIHKLKCTGASNDHVNNEPKASSSLLTRLMKTFDCSCQDPIDCSQTQRSKASQCYCDIVTGELNECRPLSKRDASCSIGPGPMTSKYTCLCSTDLDDEYYSNRIYEEIRKWLHDIPVEADESRCEKTRRNRMAANLAEFLKQLPHDADYEKNLKDAIEKCVESMPMWNPESKQDKDDFKNKLVENLTNTIKEIPKKADKLRDAVKRFVDDIDFIDDDVDKTEFIDNVINKLKEINTNLSYKDKDFNNIFISVISDMLQDLPIDTGGYNEALDSLTTRLADDVMDFLSDINLTDDKNNIKENLEAEITKWAGHFCELGADIPNTKEVNALAKILDELQSQGLNNRTKYKMKNEIQKVLKNLSIPNEVHDDLVDNLMENVTDTIYAKNKKKYEDAYKKKMFKFVYDWLKELNSVDDLSPAEKYKLAKDIVQKAENANSDYDKNFYDAVHESLAKTGVHISPFLLGKRLDKLTDKLKSVPETIRLDEIKELFRKGFSDAINAADVPENKKQILNERFDNAFVEYLKTFPLTTKKDLDNLKDIFLAETAEIIRETQLPQTTKRLLKDQLDDKLDTINNELTSEDKDNALHVTLKEINFLLDKALIPEEEKDDLKFKIKDTLTKTFDQPFSEYLLDVIKDGIGTAVNETEINEDAKADIIEKLTRVTNDKLQNVPKQTIKDHVKSKTLEAVEKAIEDSDIPEEIKDLLEQKIKYVLNKHFEKQYTSDAKKAVLEEIKNLSLQGVDQNNKNQLKNKLTDVVTQNLNKLPYQTNADYAKEAIIDDINSYLNELALPKNQLKELKKDLGLVIAQHLDRPFSDVQRSKINEAVKDVIEKSGVFRKGEILDNINDIMDNKLDKIPFQTPEDYVKDIILTYLERIADDLPLSDEQREEFKNNLDADMDESLQHDRLADIRETTQKLINDNVRELPLNKAKQDDIINKTIAAANKAINEAFYKDHVNEYLQDVTKRIDKADIPEEDKQVLKDNIKTALDDYSLNPDTEVEFIDLKNTLNEDIGYLNESSDQKESGTITPNEIAEEIVNAIEQAPISNNRKKFLKNKAIKLVNTSNKVGCESMIANKLEKFVDELPLLEEDKEGLKTLVAMINPVDSVQTSEKIKESILDDIQTAIEQVSYTKDKKKYLKNKVQDLVTNLDIPISSNTKDKLKNNLNKLLDENVFSKDKKSYLSNRINSILDNLKTETQDKNIIKNKMVSRVNDIIDNTPMRKHVSEGLKGQLEKVFTEICKHPTNKDTETNAKKDIAKIIEETPMTEYQKNDLKRKLYNMTSNLVSQLPEPNKNNVDQTLTEFDNTINELTLPKAKKSELKKKIRKALQKPSSPNKNSLRDPGPSIKQNIFDAIDRTVLPKEQTDNLKLNMEKIIATKFESPKEKTGYDLMDELVNNICEEIEAATIPEEVKKYLKDRTKEALVQNENEPLPENLEDALKDVIGNIINESLLRYPQKSDLIKKLTKIVDDTLRAVPVSSDPLQRFQSPKDGETFRKDESLSADKKTEKQYNDMILSKYNDVIDKSGLARQQKIVLKNELRRFFEDLMNSASGSDPSKNNNDLNGDLGEHYNKHINDVPISKENRNILINDIKNAEELPESSSYSRQRRPATSTPKKERKNWREPSGISTIFDEDASEQKRVNGSDESVATTLLPDNKKKLLEDKIKNWITDTLPVNLNNKTKKAVIEGIARDISDRQKYLKLNPGAKKSDQEELDNLQYQLFRLLNDELDSDELNTVVNAADDLLKTVEKDEKSGSEVNGRGNETGNISTNLWQTEAQNTVDNWLDSLPLRITSQTQQKLFDNMKKDLTSDLLKLYPTASPSELKESIKKQIRKLPLDPAKKRDGAFLEEEATRVMNELKEINNNGRGNETGNISTNLWQTEAQNTVDNWLDSLPLRITSQTQQKLFDNMKKGLTSDLLKLYPTASPSELKESIKKQIRKLPLDPAKKRDGAFLEEEATRVMNELKEINNNGRQTDVGNISAKSRQAEAQDTINNWLDSLPLHITSQPQQKLFDKIRKDMTSDTINLQPKISPSELKEQIKKHMRKLPLDPAKKRDEIFIEEEATRFINELNRMKNEGRQTDAGNISAKSRQAEAKDTINNWLDSLPLHITSQPQQKLFDKIRNDMTSDMIKLQPKISPSELKEQIKKHMRKLPLDPAKKRDEIFIEEEATRFINEFNRMKNEGRGNETGKITTNFWQTEAQNTVDNWLDSLPLSITGPTQQKAFDNMKRDLTSDLLQPSATPSELKEQIKKHLRKLPLDPSKKRDETFLEEEATRIMNELTKIDNDGRQTDAGNISAKTRQAEAQDTINNWLNSLPLHITSQPQQKLFDKIRKDMTSDTINLQTKISPSELKEQIKKHMRKLPLDPAKKRDEIFIEEEATRFINELNRMKNEGGGNETGKITTNLWQTEAQNTVDNWLDSLPLSITSPTEQKAFDDMKRDLTSDLLQPSAIPSELKEQIKKHLRKLPLDPSKKRDEKFLEEEATRIMNELTKIDNDGRQIEQGNISAKSRQTEAQDAIDNWLDSLPLSTTSQTQRNLFDNIRKDLTSDLTNLHPTMLKDKIKTYLRKLPLEPAKIRDGAFIEEEATRIMNELKRVNNDNGRQEEEKKLGQTEAQDTVDNLLNSLPQHINSQTQQKLFDKMKKALTSDLTKLTRTASPSELKERIKKHLRKLPLEPTKIQDDAFLDKEATRVMNELNNIKNGQQADNGNISSELEQSEVQKSINNWIDSLPLSVTSETQQKDFDKIRKDLMSELIKQHSTSSPGKSKGNTNKHLRKLPLDPAEKRDETSVEDEATKIMKQLKENYEPDVDVKSPEVLQKLVERHLDKLPLKSIIKDPNKLEEIKQHVTLNLLDKFEEINDNPEIYEDDTVYKEMLIDVLDSALKDLPIDQDTLFELIQAMFDEIVTAKGKQEKRTMTYKEQLENALSKTLPSVEDPTSEELADFELLKDELADAFMELQFAGGNIQEQARLKEKIKGEINKYCNDYLKKYPDKPIDTNQLNNGLLSALRTVPWPPDESLKSEVERIRLKGIIEDFVKEIALQDQTAVDKFKMAEKTTKLAKKLKDIEDTPGLNPLGKKKEREKEIAKYLVEAPLAPGHDLNVSRLANRLAEKLAADEQDRKFDAINRYFIDTEDLSASDDPRHKPYFERDKQKRVTQNNLPTCSKRRIICELTPEDLEHLERIRQRACLAPDCVASLNKSHQNTAGSPMPTDTVTAANEDFVPPCYLKYRPTTPCPAYRHAARPCSPAAFTKKCSSSRFVGCGCQTSKPHVAITPQINKEPCWNSAAASERHSCPSRQGPCEEIGPCPGTSYVCAKNRTLPPCQMKLMGTPMPMHPKRSGIQESGLPSNSPLFTYPRNSGGTISQPFLPPHQSTPLRDDEYITKRKDFQDKGVEDVEASKNRFSRKQRLREEESLEDSREDSQNKPAEEYTCTSSIPEDEIEDIRYRRCNNFHSPCVIPLGGSKESCKGRPFMNCPRRRHKCVKHSRYWSKCTDSEMKRCPKCCGTRSNCQTYTARARIRYTAPSVGPHCPYPSYLYFK